MRCNLVLQRQVLVGYVGECRDHSAHLNLQERLYTSSAHIALQIPSSNAVSGPACIVVSICLKRLWGGPAFRTVDRK